MDNLYLASHPALVAAYWRILVPAVSCFLGFVAGFLCFLWYLEKKEEEKKEEKKEEKERRKR